MKNKVEISCGILVYRRLGKDIEVLLGKCGGPKWKYRKNGWNIPKGHKEDTDKSSISTAIREFEEETSLDLKLKNCNELIDLGETKTSSGKIVNIFAIERNFPSDEDNTVQITSNLCEQGWPELSEAKYINIDEAKKKIFPYQQFFLTQLESKLNEVETIEEQIGGEAALTTPVVSDGAAGGASLNTTEVFGPEGGCDKPIVKPKEKSEDAPGLTTHDINALYVATKRDKDRQPMFKRVRFGRFGKIFKRQK